jgi:hypothetical protein
MIQRDITENFKWFCGYIIQFCFTHMYTWYKWINLDWKSKIDFILIRKRNKRFITNLRLVTHINTDTENRAVMITVYLHRNASNILITHWK